MPCLFAYAPPVSMLCILCLFLSNSLYITSLHVVYTLPFSIPCLPTCVSPVCMSCIPCLLLFAGLCTPGFYVVYALSFCIPCLSPAVSSAYMSYAPCLSLCLAWPYLPAFYHHFTCRVYLAYLPSHLIILSLVYTILGDPLINSPFSRRSQTDQYFMIIDQINRSALLWQDNRTGYQ